MEGWRYETDRPATDGATDSGPHAYSYANSDAYAHAYPHPNSDAYPDSDAYAYPDSDAYTHAASDKGPGAEADRIGCTGGRRSDESGEFGRPAYD